MKPTLVVRGVCLSWFTLELVDLRKFEVVNCNKQRVDFALSRATGETELCDLKALGKFAARDWTENGVFKPQEKSLFSCENVKALVIDTFSELADALFAEKGTNRRFAACYKDVTRTTEFWNRYETLGRIDLSDLSNRYRCFFKRVLSTYGEIPIYFLVFPSTFEEREEFLTRHKLIRQAIAEISKEFPTMKVFEPATVDRHLIDASIYHFGRGTYRQVAERLCEDGFLKLRRKTLMDCLFRRKRSRKHLRKLVLFSKFQIVYWSKSKMLGLPLILHFGLERESPRNEWLWQ